jgi:hypothetical protein
MNTFNLFQKQPQPETVLLYSDSRQGLIASQIVYVENTYHPKFNPFIRENYAAIERKFKAKGFDFIYFPVISEDFSQQGTVSQIESLLNYCYPFINNQFGYFSNQYIATRLPQSLKITTASKARKLLFSLRYGKAIRPGLLRLVSEEDETRFTFEYRQLDLSNNDYWKQIDDYLETLERTYVVEDRLEICMKEYSLPSSTVFSISDNLECKKPSKKERIKEVYEAVSEILFPDALLEETAAEPIPAQKTKRARLQKRTRKNKDADLPKLHIVEKVLNIIREAKSLGIYEEVIQDIFSALKNPNEKENIVKISRIVIDSDYRILLSDYGSLEISMATLPKALFILFLRHPEGIILKQLMDYKQELAQIYQTISNRTDLLFMSESIDRLCNPTDSSVNEKLSRIREAFIRKMSDSNASNYYVTGPRGEKKRITLQRELVSMPEELTGAL